MIEAGDSVRFALEAFHKMVFIFAAEIFGNNLNRYFPVQPQLESQPDFGHPALSD